MSTERRVQKILRKSDNLQGIDLVQAKKLWRILGGTVEPVRRKGEVAFRHEKFAGRIVANNRERRVSRALVCRLRRLAISHGRNGA